MRYDLYIAAVAARDLASIYLAVAATLMALGYLLVRRSPIMEFVFVSFCLVGWIALAAAYALRMI